MPSCALCLLQRVRFLLRRFARAIVSRRSLPGFAVTRVRRLLYFAFGSFKDRVVIPATDFKRAVRQFVKRKSFLDSVK